MKRLLGCLTGILLTSQSIALDFNIPFLTDAKESYGCLIINGTSPYRPKAIPATKGPDLDILPSHAKIDMGFYKAGVDVATDRNKDNEPDLATLASWVKYSLNAGDTDISLNMSTYEHFGISQLIKKEKYRAFKLDSTYELTKRNMDWVHLIPISHINGFGYPQACNIHFNYIMAPITEKGVKEKWQQNNKLISQLSSLLQNITVISGPILDKPLRYIHGNNNELKVTANGLYRIILRHMKNGKIRAIANVFDSKQQVSHTDSCDAEKIHLQTATSISAIELLTGLEFKGLNSGEMNKVHNLKSMLIDDNEKKRYNRARKYCAI